jgi:hypothetical protein
VRVRGNSSENPMCHFTALVTCLAIEFYFFTTIEVLRPRRTFGIKATPVRVNPNTSPSRIRHCACLFPITFPGNIAGKQRIKPCGAFALNCPRPLIPGGRGFQYAAR